MPSCWSSWATSSIATTAGGRAINKVVRFYLFAYRSGDVADHDHEIEEARWMPLEQAAEQLTYAGEREMVRRALSRGAADR